MITITLEQSYSPLECIRIILKEAQSKSGGVVERYLAGATLQKCHPDVEVPNFPGHAADVQTGRSGDFTIGDTIYHVTVTPTPAVVQKCGENIKSGLHPVLLVPGDLTTKAKSFAEFAGLEKRLSVIAIEDFIAINIIEMATGDQRKFLEILKEIVEVYNQRLEAVETDMSLKIEVQ